MAYMAYEWLGCTGSDCRVGRYVTMPYFPSRYPEESEAEAEAEVKKKKSKSTGIDTHPYRSKGERGKTGLQPKEHFVATGSERELRFAATIVLNVIRQLGLDARPLS